MSSGTRMISQVEHIIPNPFHRFFLRIDAENVKKKGFYLGLVICHSNKARKLREGEKRQRERVR